MTRVALDGPVGAGKSSVAREVSRRMGYIYVDTGALYRTVGYYCIKNGVNVEDAASLGNALKHITLEIRIIDGTQHVYLNRADASEYIRTPEMSMMASKVSAIPEVRAFLLDLQRDIAKKNSVVMDGRDIGTVILPDAEVKIFITAKPEIRAKRRFDELIAKGTDVSFDEVLSDLNRRDYNDSHRTEAPLKQAEDALLLDTSELDFEGSVQAVINIIGEKK